MTAKRWLRGVIALIFLGTLLMVYRIGFYVAPIRDQGRRNIFENVIDFIGYGWHNTRGLILTKYMKKFGPANDEYFAAAWHSEMFLRASFRISPEELDVLKNSVREMNDADCRKLIYEYAFSDPSRRVDWLLKASNKFARSGDTQTSARAFICIRMADPDCTIDIIAAALACAAVNDRPGFWWFLRFWEKIEIAIDRK